MREYDFTGLSTRSFEKLVQALAAKVLGPGLVVFGDGADGGREATFEGKVPFPSLAKGWSGYTVVQAKFHQRPEGTKADGDWAIAELKKELKDFANRKKRRRVPKYYIFVTNVVLTPAAKKGSKDRIAKVFADFKDRVPIRDFRVWDYVQLRTHLDGAEDVRRSYLPFITSGDVLAEAMEAMQNARPDFEEVMASYLANELKSTQFANLERSGEQKILLARVFVDLPSSTEQSLEPPKKDDKKPQMPGIVCRFISVASERLDPKSQRDARPRAVDDDLPGAGRYVIVGGPGQGKTTVGQFACQLFRTAILRGRPEHLIASEVLDAMTRIEELCTTERLELPRARRFPVHVTLSEFAAALSRRAEAVREGQPGVTPLTLLSFIADKIRQRTGRELSVEDLRRWLGAYAWILVLDGLDEVPSSSNRNEVLTAVEQFWIDMAQANSDILVLATTRPQDYRGDFSPRYYRHEWLTPLSAEQALGYAKRLVEEKYSPNQDRCERVMKRLERAASEENTGRLMRTPLQVTIMTTLLDQIGSPPQDRWRLFGEYYQAIYRREMERDTQKDLLSRHRSDINIIHYRVGLELQVLSEKAGRTDARLTQQQFEAIVRYRLEEQGHESSSLESLQKEIVDLAANRLVFLVGLDADSVGFEIRSLQEFMAAEALMTGDTKTVQQRLRVIAPISSWRNVFIFSAGRCFAQDEHLIDTIHTICSELNADMAGERGRVIRAGSLLAIDILEDGSVNVKPRDRKSLTRIALDIFDLPPSETHRRIAELYHPGFKQLYSESLEEALARPLFDDQIAGWALATVLAGHDDEWTKFVNEYWPNDIHRQRIILAFPVNSQWRFNKILQVLPQLPFRSARNLFFRNQAEAEPWVRTEMSTTWIATLDTELQIGGCKTQFSLGVTTVQDFARWASGLAQMPIGHPSRIPYRLTALHIDRFDERAVYEILSGIAESFEAGLPLDNLPWQISESLSCASDGNHLRAIAERIRSGHLGNVDAWKAAEQRWRAQPLELEELIVCGEPWPETIATRGFPFRSSTQWSGLGSGKGGVGKMFAFLSELAPGPLRTWLADWISWAADDERPRLLWPATTLLKLVGETSTADVLRYLDPLSDDCTILKLAEVVGGRPTHAFNMTKEIAKRVSALARDNPDRGDLIRILALQQINTDQGRSLPGMDSLPQCDPFTLTSRYRASGVAISVARGVEHEDDASRYAALLVGVEELARMVEQCAAFVERRGRFTQAEDRFFLDVAIGVGKTDLATRRTAIEILSKSARRQKSELDQPEVWQRLALPPLMTH
jgi:hypothetical protein